MNYYNAHDIPGHQMTDSIPVGCHESPDRILRIAMLEFQNPGKGWTEYHVHFSPQRQVSTEVSAICLGYSIRVFNETQDKKAIGD